MKKAIENGKNSTKQGLEKGNITVHRIFYTQKYEKFFKTLRAFANNPFLPEEIQKIAFQIGKDLRENIHSLLRAMLQNLVLKYYEATNSESPGEKIVMLEEFRHQSLYRVFEKERVKHDESFNELRKLIRKYLHIDEKW